ncbi:globin domain-containing protein [Aestuariivita boseongensis]|uniref:globin domain-containing protein n=1 Tax=Aestuariivita boseongensis TaxID=1470562 RepID=UPI000682A293|nr:globin domain-containing protein [Aestuariivita boseongensis]
MSLNSIELELLRNSYKVLSRDVETHSREFYEALFRHAPHLRALFREDLAGQGMKFMTTLGMIVDNLDQDDKNVEKYAELGELHATIGVKRSHFEPMREALIDTLRMVLGEEFTPTLEAAWREAFDQVSASMIQRGKIKEG